MVTITYEALNDLVHEIADAIQDTTGLDQDTVLDLFALNDTVTEYLSRYGVQYEDEEVPEIVNSRLSEDPTIIQAVLNMQEAITRIARIWEYTANEELADAQANLEQAVRWLTGKEEPH
jgi:hypothetical protein